MGKYSKLVKGIEFNPKDKYKDPVIEPVIIGFSGIDPDEKVTPEEIDHEALGGLLGGNLIGHYHLTNEQLTQVKNFQSTIDALRTSLNELSANLANLTNDYTAFESSQNAIELRQDNKLKSLSEAHQSLSAGLTQLEQREANFESSQNMIEERQDALLNNLNTSYLKVAVDLAGVTEAQADFEREFSTVTTDLQNADTAIAARFNALIGKDTEDMEILDARVDGDNVEHPILGDAIRHIHQQTHKEIAQFDFDIQQQTQANALANLENTLGLNKERRERQGDISQIYNEISNVDEELNKQSNTNAQGVIENALTISKEIDNRKASSERAQEELNAVGIDLQQQIDANAQANIENALNLVKEIQNRKDTSQQSEAAWRHALEHVVAEEQEADRQLSARINANEQNISANFERINGETARREHADNLIVETEEDNNSKLQSQINANAEANAENALNIKQEAETRREKLSEANARVDVLDSENENRRAEILSEVQERKQQDEVLHEALKETDKELNSEIQARVENDLGLARQSNANAKAILQTGLNLLEANNRRKADLLHEEHERINHDADLQAQVDKVSIAGVENSLAIQHEAETRRKDITTERDERTEAIDNIEADISRIAADEYITNKALQQQIDTNAQANAENAVSIKRESECRRKEIEDERNERINLNGEVNRNSEAVLTVLFNIVREAEERRQLETELIQKGKHIDTQLDLLAYAIDENILTAAQSSKMCRLIDALERTQRIEQDDGLQVQVNQLAEAVEELLLQQGRTGKNIKTLDGKVEALEIAASETGTNFASNEDFTNYMADILGP